MSKGVNNARGAETRVVLGTKVPQHRDTNSTIVGCRNRRTRPDVGRASVRQSPAVKPDLNEVRGTKTFEGCDEAIPDTEKYNLALK